MIRKTPSGWRVDIQPEGRGGKRYRKTLPTKAEALRWEAYLKAKVTQTPDWQPPRKDTRRLSDLVELWYEGHGKHLKAGRKTHQRLKHLVELLGDPTASAFHPVQFTEYRSRRISEGSSEATMNREHAHLRAMFNELTRLGHWNRDNPMEGIRQFKERRVEKSYLDTHQIKTLLKTLQGNTRKIAMICLATGARWSEAEKLRAEQVSNGQVTFIDTKNGQNRSVPISADLEEQIVNSTPAGRLFKPCYDDFRRTVKKAGLQFPDRQMTHILRHTFASHFMMNGGNILVLQRILGHQNLTMTMRYAHLAPDHLQEALRLNPLNSVDSLLTGSAEDQTENSPN